MRFAWWMGATLLAGSACSAGTVPPGSDATTADPPGLDAGSPLPSDSGCSPGTCPAGADAGAPPGCTLAFGPLESHGTGPGPGAVVAGDLDGVGSPDLAVGNFGSGISATTVSVLLQADAGFSAQREYSAGGTVLALATGDLDGDGRRDLVAGTSQGSVAILRNLGNGRFGAPKPYPAGLTANSVAVSDFNGDGRPDVAVTLAGDSRVSVFLSDGLGGLGPRADFSTVGLPTQVLAGDLNGDGKPDLVVGGGYPGTKVAVHLNPGDGTFAAKVEFEAGEAPESLALLDLDGDGDLDLAAGRARQTSVGFLKNSGDGAFAAPANVEAGEQPGSLVSADMDRDGRADLVLRTGPYGAYVVSFLRGHGDGTFSPKIDFPAGADLVRVAVADFDADGRPDLAVTNASGNAIGVLLNRCQ